MAMFSAENGFLCFSPNVLKQRF